jgi:site-specific DNA recombinase
MLLEDAHGGRFDIVLVEAFDRVSRDHGEVATLFKHLRFAVVQESKSASFMLTSKAQ